jgi:hypothetical protein
MPINNFERDLKNIDRNRNKTLQTQRDSEIRKQQEDLRAAELKQKEKQDYAESVGRILLPLLETVNTVYLQGRGSLELFPNQHDERSMRADILLNWDKKGDGESGSIEHIAIMILEKSHFLRVYFGQYHVYSHPKVAHTREYTNSALCLSSPRWRRQLEKMIVEAIEKHHTTRFWYPHDP